MSLALPAHVPDAAQGVDMSDYTDQPTQQWESKQARKQRLVDEHNARYEAGKLVELGQQADHALNRFGEYRAQARLRPKKAVLIWVPIVLALWAGVIWLAAHANIST